MKRPPLTILALRQPHMTGELVELIQSRIGGIGADGVYGPATAVGVQRWQWRAGCPWIDGKLMPERGDLQVAAGLGPVPTDWVELRDTRRETPGGLDEVPAKFRLTVREEPAKPVIVGRAQWGARPPRSVSSATHAPGQVMTLHWIGPGNGAPANGEAEAAQLRQFQAYHMDSHGWSDIGYGWAIGKSGRIYICRGKDRYGAHAGVTEANRQPGVLMLTGQGEDGVTTSAQISALKWLRAELGTRRLMGHREWTATSCPGDRLQNFIANNR